MAAELGSRAMLVAGGTDLYPKLKRRQFDPDTLVGLSHLDELRQVTGGPATGFRLGALVTLAEAVENPDLARAHPGYVEAAGLVWLCQAFSREYGANFISAMPTNLYGPNDNFGLETSHVLAALLRKTHDAKKSRARELAVWGTGTPRREFLHVDDCASACLFLLEKYDSPEIINVGCGEDISIRELAELICGVVGFGGELTWDKTKPDGTPRKLLDVSTLQGLGWTPTIPLRNGIARTYDWFLKNVAK